MEKLHSTDEVAEQLGMPPRTLIDWRLRGLGPAFIRVGRHVRYRPADVEAWLQEQTVQPRAAAAS